MRKILIALGIVAVAGIIGVTAYENWPTIRSRVSGANGANGASSATPSSAGQNSFVDAPTMPFAVLPDDRVMGKPDAPVTIIEYASFTCPHCAHFDTDVLPAVKASLIDSGKAKLVFRDYPLDALALRAAMLVRCAGPERAFGMIDLLFQRQVQWATAQEPRAGLLGIANQAGLSEANFDACMSNQDVQNAVVQSRVAAEQTYKIQSTPSFLINGRLAVGAPTPEQLTEMVESLLPGGASTSAPSNSPSSPSSSSTPER
jgi:protein-disulfide isomerase